MLVCYTVHADVILWLLVFTSTSLGAEYLYLFLNVNAMSVWLAYELLGFSSPLLLFCCPSTLLAGTGSHTLLTCILWI